MQCVDRPGHRSVDFDSRRRFRQSDFDDLVDDGLHFRPALFRQGGEAGDDQAVLFVSSLLISRTTLRSSGLPGLMFSIVFLTS
jgi:hypothetical protein